MYTIVSIEKINHIFLSGAPDNLLAEEKFFFHPRHISSSLLLSFFFLFCYQSIVYNGTPARKYNFHRNLHVERNRIIITLIRFFFFLIISYSLSYTLFFTNISLIIGNRHITRLLYSYNFRVCSPFLIFGLNIE